MRVKMDFDGIEGFTLDAVINKIPNDYRRYQEGIQVMIIVGWEWIDKIDDDKRKILVWTSLVI